MSVFNIHPKNGPSSITCCLLEATADPSDAVTDYIVDINTLDFAEEKREKMAYVPETGRARALDVGTAEIKFKMTVIGSTQAACLQNARTVTQAFRNPSGGYIEYRPHGLDSAMTTWYHYLRSPSPKLPMKAVAFSKVQMERMGIVNEGQLYGISMDYKVSIRPWATSDPTDIVTVVTGVAINNCDDSSHNNYRDVTTSLIKGDVLFPVIQVGGTPIARIAKDVLVFRHRMRAGHAGNEFFVEGEDCLKNNFSNTVIPSCSEGTAAYCSSAAGGLTIDPVNLSLSPDSAYFGAYIPLVAFMTSPGSTFDLTFSIYEPLAGSDIIWQSEPVSVSSAGDWKLLTALQEFQWPPVKTPAFLDDDSSPTVGAWARTLFFNLSVARTAGSGNIYVDFIHLAKADQGIALCRPAESSVSITSSQYIILDGFTDSHDVEVLNSYLVGTAEKDGSPMSDFVMDKGYDHRIYAYMDPGGGGTDDFLAVGLDYYLNILGIYGTIYPFDEA